MSYLVRLFKDNVRLYLPYYAFLVGTVLLASNVEFASVITYAWIACGVIVATPILYNYIFGDLNWLDFMIVAAAPILLLIVYNLTLDLVIH